MFNSVVWIMVMFSHGGNITMGPEFNTPEKCEAAAVIIADSVSQRLTNGNIRKPWCVRIQKW